MYEEMKKKWESQAPHADTTLDYALCDVYKISKQLDQLQARVKELEGALELAKNNNPYPESVFTEPTKEQFARFHEILQKEGLALDKFAGSLGRRIWNTLVEMLEQALKENE